MNKIISKIKEMKQKSYDRCFSNRQQNIENACGGLMGDTAATNYLSEKCIDCPYLKLTKLK